MRIAIIVIIVSFIFALFNSIQFFSAIAQQPPETVYLGTVHYYEDYFFYLNHFYQGANGGWLTKNQFTSESTKPSVIYWSNVLMGKIGGIFGLTPILSYNIFLIITAFITLLASFFVIRLILKNDQKALIGFIFSTFATSFMNYIFVDGKPIWYPFQLWRTPHFTFDRLGGAPHQILQTLLFYFLFLSLFSYQRKIQWFSPIIGILLTTINPVLSVLLLLFTWLIKLITRAVAWLFEHRHSHSSLTTPRFSLFAQHAALITTTLLTFITYFLLLRTLDSLPHLQSKLWEANQQSTTTPLFLLLSIGPVVVFFVAGILPAVARRNDLLIIAVLLPVICYFLFMSKIPSVFGFSNARIIFPALYAFMGAIAAEGLFWIAYRFFFIVTRLSLIAYRLSVSSFSSPSQPSSGNSRKKLKSLKTKKFRSFICQMNCMKDLLNFPNVSHTMI